MLPQRNDTFAVPAWHEEAEPTLSLRPVFDEVLLFCPEVATGGPEAMHQLAYQINKYGGSAKMAYYGPHSRLEMDDCIIRCHAEQAPLPTAFAQYQPQVLKETRLGPRTLMIYPEIMTALAALPPKGFQRALWWLSVDNAFGHNPQLWQQDYQRSFFTDPSLIHLHQSEYAHLFLVKMNAARYVPVSDYTDPDFIERSQAAGNLPVTLRPNAICYFPAKGAALAKQFVESGSLRHQPHFVRIENMSKMQVADTLFGARIYIDFGSHPGKDRVPREAAIAGAIVLMHGIGAGSCFTDHPLPPLYKFTAEDVASGRLHRRIDDILDNPQAHYEAQHAYRQSIRLERERFELEVQALFFRGS